VAPASTSNSGSPRSGAGATCIPGPAGEGACVRGTIGCVLDHQEPELTLLEQLDAAEDELGRAEHARAEAYGLEKALGPAADRLVSKAEAGSMVASARCMAAAARCLVTTEEIPE
jgi:hypothetical protein